MLGPIVPLPNKVEGTTLLRVQIANETKTRIDENHTHEERWGVDKSAKQVAVKSEQEISIDSYKN